MGQLRSQRQSQTWVLAATCTVGRSRSCDLQLEDARVSTRHALICWHDGIWELQDLHSRNGTFVDGRSLGSGERVGLREGVVLGFGRPNGYTLVSADGPRAQAVCLDQPGVVVEAKSKLLVLPDVNHPELSVYPRDDRWWIEHDGELREAQDGERVEAGAQSWQLRLPETLPETEPRGAPRLRLESLQLRLGVSDDDRHVVLAAHDEAQQLEFKARAHHLPLLMLARARLEDRALPLEQQGWVKQDELIEQLGITSNRLYVDIYRLRRQLEDAGVSDGEQIIERRPGTKQLRIGVDRIEIVRITRGRPRDGRAGFAECRPSVSSQETKP